MKKSLIYLLLLSISIILLSCSYNSRETIQSQKPQTTAKVSLSAVDEIKTLTIYSVDTSNMRLIPLTIKKEEEKTSLNEIVDMILENIDIEGIKVTDAHFENNCVIISFSSKGKPIKKCSEKIENLILEAFSNSILENIINCESIIFRMDDKAYKSKNQSFKYKEIYSEK